MIRKEIFSYQGPGLDLAGLGVVTAWIEVFKEFTGQQSTAAFSGIYLSEVALFLFNGSEYATIACKFVANLISA